MWNLLYIHSGVNPLFKPICHQSIMPFKSDPSSLLCLIKCNPTYQQVIVFVGTLIKNAECIRKISNFYFISFKLNPEHCPRNQSKVVFFQSFIKGSFTRDKKMQQLRQEIVGLSKYIKSSNFPHYTCLSQRHKDQQQILRPSICALNGNFSVFRGQALLNNMGHWIGHSAHDQMPYCG